MNEKAKYLVAFVSIIVVSAFTSYLTTLSLVSPNTQSPQTKENQQSTSNKVSLAYNITLYPDGSIVKVFSNINLHNLTIVYQYTDPNGTMVTDNVNYGEYYAGWGTGVFIHLGDTPYSSYVVPDFIQALATTYVDPQTGITKVSNPNFKVLEVYGYT